ncbi:hypothetical protein GCM10012275_05530 [Longimycelium tulufanense]|uniref:Uncharacterized protein n=1 Tax=Longimycelium tulufanense TaxID=907463 RepID=A0A8J3FUQ6_9PSEU|nr:hypothetical protein [Longimycelium tulufanense]GGM37332.1 hypothetical protein GCM10012275_05530 [Longimycelium tulufanense]
MSQPLETRVAAALLAGAGVAFLLVGIARWAVEGGPDLLLPPVVLTVFGVGVAAGLLAGWWWARRVGLVLAVVGAVFHLLIVLGGAPWWARLVSGLLAASQVYVLVLLNMRGSRERAPDA